MATTVAQLETKLNAAITKYDLAINNINAAADALRASIQAQGERDAANASNLLAECSQIATTARQAIANITAVLDPLVIQYEGLLTRITNLENSYAPGAPTPDIEVSGEDIELLPQASMIKMAYINNDPAKIALFGEILVQLKMRLDELIPAPAPDPTPTQPDGTK